jgi:hypothetical protein
MKYWLSRRQAAMRRRAELWQAMRILREFTIGELIAVCDLDGRRRAAVQTYISQLRRAGFVRVARAGHQGRHEPNTFRIARNTGPQPPAIVRYGAAMYDPNTDQEHSLETDR